MILVTGPTGNTGKVAIDHLLSQKRPTRALVRSPEKGAPLAQRDADVVVGSVDDETVWAKALAGVETVYFLVPPEASATDLVGRGKRIVDGFAAGLQAHGGSVKNVVLLSSIGAQHPTGTGPITILAHAEKRIAAAGKALTAVRASYFMENAAGMVGLMKAQGILPCFFDPAKKIPMVASADIGHVVGELLADPPAGGAIIELEGPVPVSYADVAAAFSQALGKPVAAVPVPLEGVVPALTQAGFSENVATAYREMSQAIQSGLVAFEGGRARHVRGKTTIAEIARQFAS